MKIIFIGHPGSGKTYAAKKLASLTGCPDIDKDDLLDNLVYFFFKRPYGLALQRLLINKKSWIIDGYSGKRMPVSIWNEAEHIVFINLPKAVLARNVYDRYKYKKENNERTHGQHLYANVMKNLYQIYFLDKQLRTCVDYIRASENKNKLIEVCTAQELNAAIRSLSVQN